MLASEADLFDNYQAEIYYLNKLYLSPQVEESLNPFLEVPMFTTVPQRKTRLISQR